MPNIAILNYCNLQCPYCFANRFITEEQKQIITLDQLSQILTFLNKNRVNRLGIIGGEPTLHPQFEKIILTCEEFLSKNNNKISTLVFSNGIKLQDYYKLFNKAHVLINLNEPDVVGNKNWNSIQNGLNKLNAIGAMRENVTFGINLYPDMKDFSYIFEILKKYKKDSVRCSYVAPTCKFDKSNKETYYTNAKPLFLDFVRMANYNNIKVDLDCNNIPFCYFSDQELKEVKMAGCVENNKWCNPVIDITPDMKATSCFGAYNLVDIKDFECIEDVQKYFQYTAMYERYKKNNTGKCQNCKQYQNLICQGGCLAFTN